MLRSLIDSYLFPRVCHICGRQLVDNERYVCLHCTELLAHTNFEPKADTPLFQHYARQHDIAAATALFHYTTASRLLVHRAKYHHHTALAKYLGELMAYEYADTDFLNDIDFIVPVPLHWIRKFWRGYNQSEMLCQGIATVTGRNIDTKHLVRVHNNQSQTTLNHEERRKHKQGLFALLQDHQWNGKHILLVDDVYTTGATIDACIDTIRNNSNNVTISIYTLTYAGLTNLR